MSTPTKPERIEVGSRYRQDQTGKTFTVLPGHGQGVFRRKWDDLPSSSGVQFTAGALVEGCTLIAPAPATPGTATVTPGEPCCTECVLRPNHAGACIPAKASAKVASKPPASPHDQATCMYCAGGIACPEFAKLVERVRIPADKLFPASKPQASPAYGRLVGELRAPDGTPRSALEAIQAKREPERWVESCDLLHWLRDA